MKEIRYALNRHFKIGLFIFMALICDLPISMAQGYVWDYLGDRNISGGDMKYFDFEMDSNGIPYLAYNIDNKLNVKYHNGFGWVSLGEPNFANISADNTTPSIAFDSQNNAYVVYVDASVGIRVVQFFNGSWQTVGSTGFITVSKSQSPEMTFAENTPYIVASDSWEVGIDNLGPISFIIFSQGNWTYLTQGLSGVPAKNPKIAVNSDGFPVVGFEGATDGNIYIAGFNITDNTNQWRLLGSGIRGTELSLAIADNNIPLFAYYNSIGQVSVRSYDFTDNFWPHLGPENVSTGSNAFHPDITFSGGPSLVYIETGSKGISAIVKIYENSAWRTLGTEYFTDGGSFFPKIRINTNQDGFINHVAFIDGGVGEGLSVMERQFDGDGDGKSNINDEDDDNDGITDRLECPQISNYSQANFNSSTIDIKVTNNDVLRFDAGNSLIKDQSSDNALPNDFVVIDGSGLVNRMTMTLPYDMHEVALIVNDVDLNAEWLANFNIFPTHISGFGTFINGEVRGTATDQTFLLGWENLPEGTRSLSWDAHRNSTVSGIRYQIEAICYDLDNDGVANEEDIDSDGDGCFDVVEAGYPDPDNDGRLGTSPVTVNDVGIVTGQGGYTGLLDEVNDATIVACSDCSEVFTVTAGADTDETCPLTPITINASTLLANDNASTGVALKIQELTLDNPADGTLVNNNNGTWTFTPASIGDIRLSYLVKAADESLFFENNGHFYEFITSSDITWENARSAAAGMKKNGLRGYLATITNAGENEFIKAKLEGQGWIGASDSEEEGNWKWVTGPESGTQFWSGNGSGMAVNGRYSNWDAGNVSPEPNDFQTGEDFGHLLTTGKWNDYDSPAVAGRISGYVVEFGGLEDCPDGFTDRGTLTIRVVDNENPIINCPADIVIDTDPGQSTGTPTTTEPTPTDNCGNLSYIGRIDNSISGEVFPNYNVTAGQTFSNFAYPIGVNTYLYTVTDAAGNTASCSYTITVEDNRPANAVCRNIDAVLNIGGTVTIDPSALNNGSTGAGTLQFSASITNFNCNDVGPNTVTLTVTDANSSTSTCNSVVTVIDNTTPVITLCPDDFTVNATTGQCGANVNYRVEWRDNCANEGGFTTNVQPGSFVELGITTVNLTYTDPGGNSAICTFDVTVRDAENPVVNCPANATFPVREGECFETINYSDAFSASDNCGPADLSFNIPSGSQFQLGNTTIIATATDAAGNTASCATVITIEDREDPVINCGSDLVFAARSGECVNNVTFNTHVTATDNCGTANLSYNIPTGSQFGLGSTTVTATATDDSGNTSTCSFSITIEDREDPVINCGSDLVFAARPGECVNNVNYNAHVTASDNCGTANLSYDIPTGSQFGLGSTTVTATATDNSGNTSECSFVITITDDENPVINCPADLVISTDPGQNTGTPTTTEPSPTDNCGISTYIGRIDNNITGEVFANYNVTAGETFSNFAYPIGVNTYLYTVTDPSGNSATCSYTITVQDNRPPEASCRNVVVSLDQEGSVTIDASALNDGSAGIGNLQYSASRTSFDCVSLGNNTVTLTVTDGNGNTATCNATVEVRDEIRAILDCPNNGTLATDAGQCMATGVTYSAGWTDNCGVTNITYSPASGSDFSIGNTTVVATATDAGGNTSTCSFVVTIEDNEDPIRPNLNNVIGCESASVSVPTTTDNCAGTITGATNDPLQYNTPGNYTVTWTFNDGNGNSIQVDQNVRVSTQGAFIFAPASQIDCNNETITLDASGSGGDDSSLSYSWQDGSSNSTLSISQGGTYSVTVTDNVTGCTGTESISIGMDLSKPNAVINESGTRLDCNVPSITLDAGNESGVTYQWSTGATLPIISVSEAGSYSVTITKTSNGCSDSRSINITESKEEPNIVIETPLEITCLATVSTLNASGSTGGNLSYSWSNGISGAITEAEEPGTYTVTVTDNDNGCTSTETVSVTQNISTPTAIINSESTTLDCGTESITLDGSASTGGAEGVLFIWSTGSQESSIEVNSTGEYTLGVVDPLNGCVDTTTIVITSDDDVPTASINSNTTRLDCDNESIVLDASASMASGDVTYAWSDGSSSPMIEISTPGEYSVTVTKSDNGCEASSSITIVEDKVIPTAMIIESGTQLDCNNTSIDLDASGSSGANNISYQWSDNSSSSFISVSSPGTYTVTITDEVNGCEATSSVTITEDMVLPTAEIDAPNTQLDCGTSAITLDAGGSTGNNNISYSWSTGSESASIEIGSADTYTVTVTDRVNGCTSTNSVTITQDEDIPTANIMAPVTQLDCNNSSITLDASSSSGSNEISYEWSDSSTGSTLEVTAPGQYTVTVRDAVNGCDATRTITITEDVVVPSLVVDAPVTQLDCNVSSITIDASGSTGANDLTYRWSDNSTSESISITTPGTYTVTIIDQVNGCEATSSVTITEDMVFPTAEIDAPNTQLDCGTSAITLDAGGSTGNNNISYSWSTGSESASIEIGSADTYTVTVTDLVNGCTSTNSVTITQDEDIPTANIMAPVTQLDCNNSSITLDASSSSGSNEISYEWSDNSTGSTLEVTAPGEYTVTVRDAVNGCDATRTITITEDVVLPSLEVDAPVTQLDCNVSSITIDASGSTGANDLTYRWSDNSTSESISISSPGTYTVTIMDQVNGCEATSSVTITEDMVFPNAEIDAPNTQLDCGTSAITLDAGGSTGNNNISYSWSTGSESASIEIGSTDTYTVTVTDRVNGCTSTNSVTITQDEDIPTANIMAPVTQLDCNNSSITLDASSSSGSNEISYEWSDNSTGSTLEVTAPGEYTVTVRDAVNGCDATRTITITEDVVVPSLVVDAPVTQLDCNVSSITIDASGSTGANDLTYRWSDNSTSESISITTPGTYTVTTIDQVNGCEATSSVTITEDMVFPTAEIDAPNTQLDCGTSAITLDAGGSTGNNNISYSWSTGSESASIEIGSADTYTVTVTDLVNGCISTNSVTITQDEDIPTANIMAPVTQLDCNNSSITLDASSSSGSNEISYEWSDNSTGSTLEVTAPGEYTVTVRDAVNGCDATRTITITEDVVVPSLVVDAPVTQLDCNVSSITIDASGSTGANDLAFSWSDNSTSESISITTPGTYTVTITDQVNGCIVSESVTIVEDLEIPSIEISEPSLLTCDNPNITLNASGSNPDMNVTYQWSNGSEMSSIDVSSPGDYSLTITNAINGCTSTETVSVNQDGNLPTALIASSNSQLQLDCGNSSITLDASNSTSQNNIMYSWSQGGNESAISVDQPGTYEVTITDEMNGCTAVQSITISEDFESPSVSISSPELLTCSTPSFMLGASVDAQGDYSYAWSTNATSADIEVTAPGDYTLTVTNNANSCTSIEMVIIEADFSEPTLDLIVPTDQIDCRTPVVMLDASGSSSANGVIYAWSIGSDSPSISVEEGGSYTVTITDAISGCSKVESTTLTKDDSGGILVNVIIDFDGNPEQTSWSIETPFVSEEDQPIQVASGGPYDTNVANLTSQTFTACLTEGCYDFYIKDSANDGLQGSVLVMTEFGDTLVFLDDFNSAIKGSGFCVEELTFKASIASSGGTHLDCYTPEITLQGEVRTQGMTPSYEWTNGESVVSTESSLIVTMAGKYYFIITDMDSDLTDTTFIEISEDFAAPTITIAPWEIEDCNDPNVLLDASDSSGEGDLVFSWSTDSEESSINVTATGTYQVTVTNISNGCAVSSDVAVFLDNIEQVMTDFLTPSNACTGDTLHFIDYSMFEGMAMLEFFWDFGNGQTSTERDPLLVFDTEGQYTVSLLVTGTDCPSPVLEKPVVIVDCKSIDIEPTYARLSPTLNTGSFTVSVDLPQSSDVRIDIYDLNGKMVQTEFFSDQYVMEQEFNLLRGVYLVSVRHMFGMETYRTIVVD